MRKGSALPLLLILVVLAILLGGYLIWHNSISAPVYNIKPPVGTQGGKGSSSSAGIKSTFDPNQSGLANYPDKAIDFDISTNMSVNTLITHRSALNGKSVTVHGFVIKFTHGFTPPKGMGIATTLPTLIIADSMSSQRDTHYDLEVILSNWQTTHTSGQEVTIKGVVSGNKWQASVHSN